MRRESLGYLDRGRAPDLRGFPVDRTYSSTPGDRSPRAVPDGSAQTKSATW